MSSKTDDYNALVNIIERIIRTTSDPHEKEDLDKAFDIVRGVGEGLEVLSDDSKQKE